MALRSRSEGRSGATTYRLIPPLLLPGTAFSTYSYMTTGHLNTCPKEPNAVTIYIIRSPSQESLLPLVLLEIITSGHIRDVGDMEYIRGRIFDAVDHDRTITCRGTLIRISNPNAAKGTAPYWIQEETTQDAEYTVPAGYEVEVIDGWVKLSK